MRQLPKTGLGWVIFLWGVVGVFLFILNPVIRLGAVGFETFDYPLGPVHWVALAVWLVFMVYTEGWRGFHKQFAPRVVVRSIELANQPKLLPALLAPLTAMGMIHATRKRKIVTWCLLIGIAILVVLVRQLEQPWRGIVDLGVIAGLSVGLVSIAGWFVATLMGRPSQMPSDMP